MPEAPKRSQIFAWSVTVGLAASISLVLLFAARAAQREARFVELVRPRCAHMGLTNEELHRLVRSEFKPGARKPEALQAVTYLCEARQRAGKRYRAESALTRI
ncbi:hypothetical protein SAMN05444161_1695 [Rhizobiales bacterium GAS191]|jgi:hypothetical protein|nr:hypothetical protein SAMN05519103_00803 [Rhizobiales bacterium GAS113]SEC56540.1 hypothetical protein SAMN05519104_1622 [Rhizobiales bacterium GAS188]SEC71781.1 hypothetical protein SAMN05444161_1695 [Rhizobiales bacterium GAS191]